jgi:hypothetical protein
MNIKDKKYIITLGCSFSTSNDENLVEKGHTFGDVIAKHYDMELIELGVPAGSNQYIKNRFFEWFGKNPNKWNDTFVVVAWTEPGRHMWWNNKTNEWFNDTNQIYIKDTVRFNKDNLIHEWTYKERRKYAQNFMQNTYDEMRDYLEQIITLQTFMKLRNIPYIMFNSLFDVFEGNHLSPEVKDSPDGTNQIMCDNLVDETFFYKEVFANMVQPNQELWIRYNDTHPGKKAHEIWGNYLIEFIEGVYV